MHTHLENKTDDNLAVILRLARHVLRGVPDRGADAAEVVKVTCARLRISYSTAVIGRVLDVLENNPHRRAAPRLATISTFARPRVVEEVASLLRPLVRSRLMPERGWRLMREWRRHPMPTRCGGCGAAVPVGAPACVVSGPGLRARVRCATCAGPVPADLPDLDERPEGPTRAERVEAMRRRAFHRLSGQAALPLPVREPGEEG